MCPYRSPWQRVDGLLTYNQMVVLNRTAGFSDEEVDRLFHALADRTRRDVIRRTLVGTQSVSALASHYDMSFAAVQKHVAVLEHAGLVTKETRGRERLVKGNPTTIHRARALLDQYEALWRDRVAGLDALLASPAEPPEPHQETSDQNPKER